jgi:hypothetical protein
MLDRHWRAACEAVQERDLDVGLQVQPFALEARVRLQLYHCNPVARLTLAWNEVPIVSQDHLCFFVQIKEASSVSEGSATTNRIAKTNALR